MKKTKVIPENYLEKIPFRNPMICWSQGDDGLVSLEIHNTGFFNRIAQKLLKKPKVSYVHLDEMGSFLWPLLDGEENLIELGKKVDEHFGEKAHPLYERLSKYIQILESYGFVIWVKK